MSILGRRMRYLVRVTLPQGTQEPRHEAPPVTKGLALGAINYLYFYRVGHVSLYEDAVR